MNFDAFWAGAKIWVGPKKGLQLVVATALAAVYSAVANVLLNTYLPADEPYVNQEFVAHAWPILLLAAVLLWALNVLYAKARPSHSAKELAVSVKPQPADLLLLFLPLTPVAQYVLTNQDILSFTGGLLVMGVFALLAATLSLLIPRLLFRFGQSKALMLMGLAFCFSLFNMAALTGSQTWYQEGSLPIQLGVLGAAFALLYLVYGFVGQGFARIVVVLFFVSNSTFSYLNYEKPATDGLSFDGNNSLVQLVGSRQPNATPNIYILVYDGYVNNETMLNYGIDNSAQERFLVESGFKLYPHTYSLAAYTVGTMSRVFSVTNAFSGGRRSAAAGNGAVHQLLKGFGYQTYGLFWSDYFFQENGTFYDHSYPNRRPSHWLLLKAILMGEFRFDIDFEAPTREEFMEHKNSVWNADHGAPKMVYMHANRPNHTQNSGKCLPDERELFQVRLAEANTEMKRNVDDLLQQDPGAIIVVAGDHGPYLTKNCTSTGDHYEKAEITREDVQDRYGTFLAIYWPSGYDVPRDDIVVIQDIFPAIFSQIFADDRYLKARVKPRTVRSKKASGVSIRNGIIDGGVNDGEPLFFVAAQLTLRRNLNFVRKLNAQPNSSPKDAMMDRREFVKNAGVLSTWLGVSIVLHGCSEDDSPTAPSAGSVSGVIGANHGHAVAVTAAQLTAAGAVVLSMSGGSHTHSVSLSATQVGIIAAGNQVQVSSGSGNGHTHTVTFN